MAQRLSPRSQKRASPKDPWNVQGVDFYCTPWKEESNHGHIFTLRFTSLTAIFSNFPPNFPLPYSLTRLYFYFLETVVSMYTHI